jgi:hypothetical protein
MNRRDALSRVALILGGTVVGANLFLEGCKPTDKKASGGVTDFTPDDMAYLDEIAETIIPATDTPGAKAAKVGAFMTVMVKDCYEEKDQKTFRMAWIKSMTLQKRNSTMHSCPSHHNSVMIFL